MVEQKLELKFWNGVMVGALCTFLICSGIVGEFFVSKEVFKLKTIYLDGKIYKLCRLDK
jgi:formate/nitrite transporter FocA (FNT family)